MATSTFDRAIVIKDKESLKRLALLMSDETPAKPIKLSPDYERDKKRSEKLLKQCLYRSGY